MQFTPLRRRPRYETVKFRGVASGAVNRIVNRRHPAGIGESLTGESRSQPGIHQSLSNWPIRLSYIQRETSEVKKVAHPHSITERRVPELIPVPGSHKSGGRLPLLSARPAVTLATFKEGCYQFCCLVNRGVSSLPKTVTRQHRDWDLNPGPSAPESSTLTTRLPRHPSLV